VPSGKFSRRLIVLPAGPGGTARTKASALLTLVMGAVALWGQSQLPMEPMHDAGQSITGAFEGWFKNPDGSFSLLLGYFNRNAKEELDIPVGPNNRIDPGGPDQGQPTHFLPRRQWGVFTVTVPKDFGTKMTWTLVANRQTSVIPMSLDPLWEVSPFYEVGMGNTPPVIRFEEDSAGVQGPRPITTSLTTTLPNPVTLTVWLSDDAKTFPNAKPPKLPAVTIAWGKYRGPGNVTFSNARPAVEKTEGQAPFNGKATTTATFSQPGDYILRVVANDWSGDGGRGFQCCWTNAMVNVAVKP
jgi:hypothetical protein